jgi:hypothetical protein
MLLKELINKSWYGATGYIAKEDDLNILEQYIVFNLPVLKEYHNIIVATNYDSQLQYPNTQLWKKYFPECIILDSEFNRGHNFGTADLDNIVFDYCKKNNIEWLCKSANDVIFKESVLNKKVGNADFYYLNGVGYGGMVPFDFNFEKIIEEAFYPQTNFYFINISKCDFLNDKKYLDETYKHIQTFSNYNGKVWEYIDGWSCENFLKKCVSRNKLIKEHLVPEEKYRILLQVIKDNQIHDCSHKNILIEGICHFPYSNQTVIEI